LSQRQSFAAPIVMEIRAIIAGAGAWADCQNATTPATRLECDAAHSVRSIDVAKKGIWLPFFLMPGSRGAAC
jgi:hypothetical protein